MCASAYLNKWDGQHQFCLLVKIFVFAFQKQQGHWFNSQLRLAECWSVHEQDMTMNLLLCVSLAWKLLWIKAFAKWLSITVYNKVCPERMAEVHWFSKTYFGQGWSSVLGSVGSWDTSAMICVSSLNKKENSWGQKFEICLLKLHI